ncbi:MAG: HlyC/CorC family transporter [Gemmatimonadaceae bacterium]|nr:HlyC/CorC family transporter [Gemmatimonadaceae bacterium]
MIPGLVLALVGAALAYACAAADGALLALDPEQGLPEPLRALHARRERAHRALAFARVTAQLLSGVGVAVTLGLDAIPFRHALWQGGLAAVVLVMTSESLARSRGTIGGLAVASRRFGFILLMERLLAPIVTLGSWFDQLLHRLLPPAETPGEDRQRTADQFRQVVASEAEVSKDQEVLLNGVFRLGQTAVHELMIPRVDIVAIDREAPWSEVVDRLRSAEHARLPVFTETIDNVTGILFAKDVLPLIVADEVPDDWPARARPPVFIPAGKSADAQLRDFQATGMHIAIVADEFGGTAGLITIEDVLEEIVGDIHDEYDEDEPRVESDEGWRFWVSGRMTLDELSELVSHDLRHDEVSTVGGLVYELLGRVPRAGEDLEFRGFRVVIERVVRRRITRVYLERLDDRSGDAAGQEDA